MSKNKIVKYIIMPFKAVKYASKSAILSVLKIVKTLAYRNTEVVPDKIFFMSFDNRYSCNLSYIADEILRQKLPVDMVWAIPKEKGADYGSFPEKIRLVKRNTIQMYEEQASAKIWFDNALNCVWYDIPKKDEQVYINTWHGSMGIKRLSGNRYWMRRAKKADKVTDYMVSNSSFEEDVYRGTFWKKAEILKYGHARNDILFATEQHEAIRNEITEFYGIPATTKIALYAPTFRDDGDNSCFNLNYESMREALEKKFGGEWVVLVRAHFKNRDENIGKRIRMTDKILDGSRYADMQRLMIAADCGITDYSSWAYDYILTKKPMFIYAEDIEKYNSSRGFYFSLDSTPFLIAKNTDEMIANIASFDDAEYLDKVDKFLEDKGCYETGTAAKQVVEKIKEIMNL